MARNDKVEQYHQRRRDVAKDRKQRVVEYAKAHPDAKQNAIAEEFDVEPSTISRYLNEALPDHNSITVGVKDEVVEYARNHPDARQIDMAEELGYARTTISRHLREHLPNHDSVMDVTGKGGDDIDMDGDKPVDLKIHEALLEEPPKSFKTIAGELGVSLTRVRNVDVAHHEMGIYQNGFLGDVEELGEFDE